jgi:hypothetical protein
MSYYKDQEGNGLEIMRAEEQDERLTCPPPRE